jgi:hypothetical protein
MPMTMPGALTREHTHVEAVTRAASVKSHGELGDVYNFTPRDAVLGRGGITFTSLDFVQKLPGCTPILHVTGLRTGRWRGVLLCSTSRPVPVTI